MAPLDGCKHYHISLKTCVLQSNSTRLSVNFKQREISWNGDRRNNREMRALRCHSSFCPMSILLSIHFGWSRSNKTRVRAPNVATCSINPSRVDRNSAGPTFEWKFKKKQKCWKEALIGEVPFVQGWKPESWGGVELVDGLSVAGEGIVKEFEGVSHNVASVLLTLVPLGQQDAVVLHDLGEA